MRLMRAHLAARVRRPGACLGWTLAEMMVSIMVATLLITGAMTFLFYAEKTISTATQQTYVTQQAGYAYQFIAYRMRLATLVSNDSAGNILTLAFDTNCLVDSSNGVVGIPWANQDYFEQFKFVGVNTTNAASCATNQLVWIPNTQSTNYEVLIPCGVRNLPGHNIFSVTNTVLATICFGVVDTNPQDLYQESDIQTMAASLNRPQVNNMFTILPAP